MGCLHWPESWSQLELVRMMQGAYIGLACVLNQTSSSDLPRTASPVRDGSYSPSIQPVSPSPRPPSTFPPISHSGLTKYVPSHSSNQPHVCSLHPIFTPASAP